MAATTRRSHQIDIRSRVQEAPMKSRQRSRVLAGIAVTVTLACWGWQTASKPRTEAPMTREQLAARFQSDIRNLVYRWNPKDDRAPEQQHAALFAFVHQTYDTTAWIPQSLFDNNVITQAVAGDV